MAKSKENKVKTSAPKLRSLAQLNRIAEDRFPFEGDMKSIFGKPTTTGMWLIYGEEKHGKTTLSLILADYFSKYVRVHYMSAEEGLDGDFRAAIRRANVKESGRNLLFSDYIGLEALEELLAKKQASRVVIVDNITSWIDELAYGKLRYLHQKYKDKVLFIFLAHEENKVPYPSTAKLCKRLSKVIIRVEGMTGFVGGRISSKRIIIEETKAMLYHGSDIKSSSS